jgi:hypothetical protein
LKPPARNQKGLNREKIKQEEIRAAARYHLGEARKLLRAGDTAGVKKECAEARSLDSSLAPEIDSILAKVGGLTDQ